MAVVWMPPGLALRAARRVALSTQRQVPPATAKLLYAHHPTWSTDSAECRPVCNKTWLSVHNASLRLRVQLSLVCALLQPQTA